MAGRASTEALRMQLAQKLETFRDRQPSDLVRSAQLGETFSFAPGLPVFEKAFALFRQVGACDVSGFTDTQLERILRLADKTVSTFEAIWRFVPGSANAAKDRDNLIRQVETDYEESFNALAPLVAYSCRTGKELEALLDTSRERLMDLESSMTAAQVTLTATREESAALVRTLREGAAKLGVTQHALHFKAEADQHLSASRWWLAATVMMAVLCGMWGVAILHRFLPEATSTMPQVISLTVAKLVVLSALYYGLVWCGRNYAAHRHNCVVNRHRQNALSSFESFVKAAGDADTRNAVLLQATQAIFLPQQTGYIVKDVDADQPTKVVEIMRAAAAPPPK